MKRFRMLNPEKEVVFVVDRVPLAFQQAAAIKGTYPLTPPPTCCWMEKARFWSVPSGRMWTPVVAPEVFDPPKMVSLDMTRSWA
jgi:hypothetical protein